MDRITKELCARFPISRVTVRDIWNSRSWVSVTSTISEEQMNAIASIAVRKRRESAAPAVEEIVALAKKAPRVQKRREGIAEQNQRLWGDPLVREVLAKPATLLMEQTEEVGLQT
eukprot:1006679-Rhodomonas_salina.1